MLHTSSAHPQTQALMSSTSTLWAQASKEWVIPAKPKPGRKPKMEVIQHAEKLDEADEKGRRVQNRAAQRAFRERKQSQLADLQARLQSYEQGEIERNVALQNVAKRLKDENEALRTENKRLKEETVRLKSELKAACMHDRKRWRTNSLQVSDTFLLGDEVSRKRTRTQAEDSVILMDTPHAASYTHSPPSIVSSPDSQLGSDTFSPLPLISSSSVQSNYASQESLTGNLTILSGLTKSSDPEPSFDAFDCGLCNENTPCVCRELALNQVPTLNDGRPTLKVEAVDQVVTASFSSTSSPTHSSSVASILDSLPAYQPAVPLRRMTPPNPARAPLFQIRLQSPLEESSSQTEQLNAVCSGDPSNCPACADDAFGKAFCTALGDSASSIGSCSSCPERREHGSNMESRSLPSGAVNDTGQLQTQGLIQQGGRTMSCSDAWRQLKSHPNIAFADLTMLADVVARRTKCSGPLTSSESSGDECIAASASTAVRDVNDDNSPVLLIDPHAHYRKEPLSHATSQSPFSLVPEDILVRCGRKRLREVDTAGVNEALRILDGQFGRL